MSKKVFPLLLALSLFPGVSAFAQTPGWSQLPNSPSGTSRHDDIFMLNETTGWSARGRAGVHKTTDGGNTWTQVYTNTVAHFRSIAFLSATHGFIGNLGPGAYDVSVTDTNLLYETFDGGTTWTNHPGFSEAGMRGICSFYVLDSQTIYGGGRVRGPAHFIKSTDGGTNWTILDLSTNGLGVMGGIMDVYFKDKTNGFLVGMDTNSFATSCGLTYYGRIARTTDGGTNWTAVATTGIPCCYFWKMSWPSPNVGYVSLQQNVTSNTNLNNTLIYYKTIDGGATWSSNGVPLGSIDPALLTSTDGFYWQGVGFVTTNEGWAGGSGLGSPYNFLHTTNGGTTWVTAGYNNSASINRIRVLSPTLAYASGQKIHVFKVALAITTAPTNQTVNVSSNVTFNAVGQGSVGLAYQWRLNGTNISSANTNSYGISNVQTTNAGSYTIVVSDYSGAVTSSVATLTVSGVNIAPSITTQPQSVTNSQGQNANFTVTATGTAPLNYQWRFTGTNISGATDSGYTRTNTQAADAGSYTVVVTNIAGSVTSAVATLTVVSAIFSDNFDSYSSPVAVTHATTTNGYKIFFSADSGAEDFKAVFGFNYSTVTYPTTIPSAPNSSGGSTKGLFLTSNKDATAANAGINLYPVGQAASGNFTLKFDLWLNWDVLGTSSEHALFGINHSGNITNRISQATSDGLFFAMDGDANVSAVNTTFRDFTVLRGSGNGAIPVFMGTNNTTFGPAAPLGPQFDYSNPGFVALFPSKTIPGFGSTPAGSPGLGWVSCELRQETNVITCLLNGTSVAQYTNTFAYTNGNILIGYSDNFSSIGTSNVFAIFDNIRVEAISTAATVLNGVTILSPRIASNNFVFDFVTESTTNYAVQRATSLTTQDWQTYANIVGNGSPTNIIVPLLPFTNNITQQYFRVIRP